MDEHLHAIETARISFLIDVVPFNHSTQVESTRIVELQLTESHTSF